MRRFAARGVAALVLASFALAAVLASSATLAAGVPAATTGASSAVTDTQATLAGAVNPQGQLTSYAFQYGTTTSYGQQSALASAGSGSADVPVTANLAGLTAGTTYHYRVIGTNTSGTAVGADKTFATTGTAPPPPTAPSASTGGATATGTLATVTGSVTPNGVETSYYFEFGETGAYGQQTPPQSAGSGSAAVSVTAALSALKADTTYHYRLVAVGPQGAFALGLDKTFSAVGVAATRLGLFGQTAFTDQHGVGGVFVACIGTTPCTGSLTLARSGKQLGARPKYTLKANDGSFVHVTLNALGQRLLRARGTMNVQATVATPAAQKDVRTVKLVRYSTLGLRG